MQIPVKSRIKRKISKCRNYFTFDEAEKQKYSGMLSLCENEEIYGVYRNPAPFRIEIVVSDQGLHILEDNFETAVILFRQILELDSRALSDKHKADRFILHLKDGSTQNIIVAGTFEETSDVYLFYTFMMRVIGDIERH